MEVDPITEVKVQIAVLQTQLNSLIVAVTDLKADLRAALIKVSEQNVSKEEFDPIKRIVYGLVGLTLTSVATAILAFFLMRR